MKAIGCSHRFIPAAFCPVPGQALPKSPLGLYALKQISFTTGMVKNSEIFFTITMVKKASSKAYRPNKLFLSPEIAVPPGRLFELSLFDQKGLFCENLVSQMLTCFSYSDI